MKLSDVRGERTLEVVADLIGPVASIATDEEVMALFVPKTTPEGITPNQYFAQRMAKAVPQLVRGHKDDIVSILATIGGKTPEEYKSGMTLPSLMKDVTELLTDDGFADFFQSLGTSQSG